MSEALDQIDHTSTFEPFHAMIPLSRLRLTALNVRQTERDADVASLAEDIAQRGLKQNLVVCPAHFLTAVPLDPPEASPAVAEAGTAKAEQNFKGMFEVSDGGRRTQALRLLVEQDRLDPETPVACLVEPRDHARESSLSTHLHKVAMNPADEFEAFHQIAAEQREKLGAGEADAIAYVARRFGVTARHVEGRLRLAALAPEILEALRTNAIGLESAKAYARTGDHKLQLKVFKDQCKSTWKSHDPRAIRDALGGKTVPLDDPRVKFVSIETYRANGGVTEIEMFMGAEGAERVLDVALLDKLVKEQAEAALPALAKAGGWKDAKFAVGIGWNIKWPKEPAGFRRTGGWVKPEAPGKAVTKKAIALFKLADDGGSLCLAGWFEPEKADKSDQRGEIDWQARQREANRERAIVRLMGRKAAGGMLGDAGDLVWPRYGLSPVEREDDNEDHVLVAVQIRVPVAALESFREEATREHDEQMAEEERRAAEAETEEVDA